ncbi:MAG: hypothetical protein AAB386_04205 [Patescibacteria group bacterium]
MSVAGILLDREFVHLTEIPVALEDVIEEFRKLREELKRKCDRERLMRPPSLPQKKDTPIPPSPRVPGQTVKPGKKPIPKKRTVPPPTKGRRR